MNSNYLLFAFFLSLLICGCTNDDNSSGNSSNFCTIEVPCGNPEGLISVAEASQMEEDYRNQFYNLINEFTSGPYPDYEGAGRYVWFDLEEVKKFIVYVEKHADERGYNGNLGLRVYMGAKMQNNSVTGDPEPRQTVYFVPTVNPSGGTNLEDNLNIVSSERLNLGGAGIPDGTNSNVGIGN